MTAYQLQKDLCTEVELVLKDMLLPDPAGNLVNVKAYSQNLPKREQNITIGNLMEEDEADDGKDPYPFCVVRLDTGSLKPAHEVQKVKTVLVFGIFDDSLENKGHEALLNIFERVTERFIREPLLNDRYRLNEEEGIDWAVNDEDWYPYYVGAMELTWDTFFVTRKEDKYA